MRTEVAAPVLESMLEETQRLVTEKVPEPEMDAARRSLPAGFTLSLEDPNQLLNYMTLSSIHGFSKDYWNNYPVRIMVVTAEEVQTVSRKYLDPAHLQIVVAGDAKKIVPALKNLRSLETKSLPNVPPRNSVNVSGR